jgi:hypothetical protein
MQFWNSCSVFLSFSVASWLICCSRSEAEELGMIDMLTRFVIGFGFIEENVASVSEAR